MIAGSWAKNAKWFPYALAGLALFIVLLIVILKSMLSLSAEQQAFMARVLQTDGPDHPCVIANMSGSTLEFLKLVSDHAVCEIGRIGPGQTLIDAAPAGLGEIDYHFEYVIDGKPMRSGDLYSGAQPSVYRLTHRFEEDANGKYTWVVLGDGPDFHRVDQRENLNPQSAPR